MPPPTPAHLGLVIRKAREEKELSIEALAAKAGISWRYLSRIEGQGKRSANPTWNVLGKIARNLDMEVSELARRAEAIAHGKSA